LNFDYFDHLNAGWFGVNILVPVGGPLFFLWLISKFNIVSTMTKNIVIKSIGKGELFWAVMGMAASTIYELDGIKSIATDPNSIVAANWATGGHILIIVISVLMVGFNSLEPVTPSPPPTGTPPPPPPPPSHVPDKFIFGSSVFCLLLVIATYAGVHSKLTEQEENVRKTAIMKAQECIAKAKGDARHCVEDMK
jgi:hypothetical protein